jgi:hypothetical protein
MAGPYFFPGRPQAEKYLAIFADEQRSNGLRDLILHLSWRNAAAPSILHWHVVRLKRTLQ